jgi:hypothetical protein
LCIRQAGFERLKRRILLCDARIVKVFMRRVDRISAVHRGVPDIGCDRHVATAAK